jgi:hypothetical protein
LTDLTKPDWITSATADKGPGRSRLNSKKQVTTCA